MVKNTPKSNYWKLYTAFVVKPYLNEFSYLPCWLNNHSSRPWFQWWKPVVLFLELIAEFGHKFRWFRWGLYRLIIFKRSLLFTILSKNLKKGNSTWQCCCAVIFFDKVEKNLKGSLDLIPSPSVKNQIMGGKVCLRCKGKTLLGDLNTKSLLTSPSNAYLK